MEDNIETFTSYYIDQVWWTYVTRIHDFSKNRFEYVIQNIFLSLSA